MAYQQGTNDLPDWVRALDSASYISGLRPGYIHPSLEHNTDFDLGDFVRFQHIDVACEKDLCLSGVTEASLSPLSRSTEADTINLAGLIQTNMSDLTRLTEANTSGMAHLAESNMTDVSSSWTESDMTDVSSSWTESKLSDLPHLTEATISIVTSSLHNVHYSTASNVGAHSPSGQEPQSRQRQIGQKDGNQSPKHGNQEVMNDLQTTCIHRPESAPSKKMSVRCGKQSVFEHGQKFSLGCPTNVGDSTTKLQSGSPMTTTNGHAGGRIMSMETGVEDSTGALPCDQSIPSGEWSSLSPVLGYKDRGPCLPLSLISDSPMAFVYPSQMSVIRPSQMSVVRPSQMTDVNFPLIVTSCPSQTLDVQLSQKFDIRQPLISSVHPSHMSDIHLKHISNLHTSRITNLHSSHIRNDNPSNTSSVYPSHMSNNHHSGMSVVRPSCESLLQPINDSDEVEFHSSDVGNQQKMQLYHENYVKRQKLHVFRNSNIESSSQREFSLHLNRRLNKLETDVNRKLKKDTFCRENQSLLLDAKFRHDLSLAPQPMHESDRRIQTPNIISWLSKQHQHSSPDQIHLLKRQQIYSGVQQKVQLSNQDSGFYTHSHQPKIMNTEIPPGTSNGRDCRLGQEIVNSIECDLDRQSNVKDVLVFPTIQVDSKFGTEGKGGVGNLRMLACDVDQSTTVTRCELVSEGRIIARCKLAGVGVTTGGCSYEAMQCASAGMVTDSCSNEMRLCAGAGMTTDSCSNEMRLCAGAGMVTDSCSNEMRLCAGAGMVTDSCSNEMRLCAGAGMVTYSCSNEMRLCAGAGMVTDSCSNEMRSGAGTGITSDSFNNGMRSPATVSVAGNPKAPSVSSIEPENVIPSLGGRLPGVKDSLKRAIFSKIRLQGKNLCKPTSMAQPCHVLTEEEELMRQQRLEVNRRSAASHRERKRAEQEALEAELADLERKNIDLKRTKADLEAQKLKYMNWMCSVI